MVSNLRKALIFGINGQDGHYLTKSSRKREIEVIGVSRSSGNWIIGDVSDYSFVENMIKKYKPDFVFHIAANSTTKHFALIENHHTISSGAINILESVKKHSSNSKVFIVGSGVQFVNKHYPISENDHFEANNAYSIARIQSVYAARYFRSIGINAYVGYLFHHESPLRKDSHISKIIINLVKNILDGNSYKIEMGDIDVIKEWAYAEDIAEGIYTLMEQDTVFEATIGSGIGYTIKDWIEICFELINKKWDNYISLKSGFEPEYKYLVSNPATINSLGWYPKTSILDLAKIMLYDKSALIDI
jgi:GDPmannose 4,6-dehydratase